MDFIFANEEIKLEITAYLSDFIEEIEDENYKFECEQHKYRHIVTMMWIVEMIKRTKATSILVLGQDSIIDWCLKDLGYLKECEIYFTDFDLREVFPYQDDDFDFIINTEVVEHLKDIEGSRKDILNYSGINNALSECSRVLKKGGGMLLTTPNACSTDAICRLVMNTSPMSFEGHIREYTIRELLLLLSKHSFSIDHLETVDCFMGFYQEQYGKSRYKYLNSFLLDYIPTLNKILKSEILDDLSVRGAQIFLVATNGDYE